MRLGSQRLAGLEPRLLRAMAVVLSGTVLVSLDLTMVNVAFARLRHDLHATIVSTQWVTTSYTLALACSIPVSGWAARRFGPRRMFLIAMATFVVGSLCCGASWSLDSLVASRVLQGVGGGIMLPTGQMILAQAAGPRRIGRVMGLVTSVVVLAPILGPTLGGLIVDTASWRWLFFINLPVGIAGIILGRRFLPHTVTGGESRLDVRGFVLVCLGLLSFTYGLAQIGSGTTDRTAIWFVLAGVLMLALFVIHAHFHDHPLLDMSLYGDRIYLSASAALFVLGMSQMTAIVLVPLYLQDVRGTNALTAGLLYAPLPVGIGLTAPLAGRLSDRHGGGVVAMAGVLLLAVASFLLATVGAHTSLVAVDLALFIRGVGLALSTTPVVATAYSAMSHTQVTDAAPQLTMLQRVGSAVGLTIFAVILQHALHGIPAGHLSQTAAAYAETFLWIAVCSSAAIVPIAGLIISERRSRLPRDHTSRPDGEEAGSRSGPRRRRTPASTPR